MLLIVSNLLKLMYHIKSYLHREIIFYKLFRKLNVDVKAKWLLSVRTIYVASCHQWIHYLVKQS